MVDCNTAFTRSGLKKVTSTASMAELPWMFQVAGTQAAMLGHKCEHVYEMALEMTRKYSSPAESRLLELAGLAFLRLNLRFGVGMTVSPSAGAELFLKAMREQNMIGVLSEVLQHHDPTLW